ncbi:MAG: DegT/DnrJ/EryC1/StrS family aminotransferase [Gemmatimonadaceae bacterium]|nr:DegT/DnrJ/EryC1/StrS family aminotransferase [Gemmatimonadaceae bacterium]
MRRLPPVYSPLSFAAVRAAWGGADVRAPLTTALQARFPGRGVVLTDSGTSALAVALRIASRSRQGRLCALPAYGCYDLISAALAAGVRVELYDVDPRTLQPDLPSLTRAVSRGIAAVVVVHHCGVPAALAPVREVIRDQDALLIEDAAQGAGGVADGVALGGAGDLGVLSFGRGKGITGGGGGALLVHDHALIETAAREVGPSTESGGAAFGLKLAAQWALARPSLYAIPASLPFLGLGETVFRPPTAPLGLRRATARVLLHTLPEADAEADLRRAHVARLRAAVRADVADRFIPVSTADRAGWLRFPVRGARTPALMRSGAMLGCVPGYPQPLTTLPQAQSILDSVHPVPGATELATHLWTVPVHGLLTPSDLDAIARWLNDLPR